MKLPVSGYEQNPKVADLPVIKASLPPKDICNDHLFTYVADSSKDLKNPLRVLYMEPTREAYSYMMNLLNYLADRSREYEKLPIDDPQRIIFEYRRWIIVMLMCSDNRGVLDIADFKAKIKKWTRPAYYKDVPGQKYPEAVGEIYLDKAISEVINTDLHITQSTSYIKKPLPK